MAIRRKTQSRSVKLTNKERLANLAVAAAKYRTIPVPPLQAEGIRVPEQRFYMTARVYEGNNSFLARVPFVLTTIPELTEVIIIEEKAYVLHTTYPLTYRCVFSGRATRIA